MIINFELQQRFYSFEMIYVCLLLLPNTMSTVELRNKIYDSLNTVEDSSVLEKVFNYIENIRANKDIVAYTVKGKPITKKEYIQQVKDADKSITAGNYTTVEDIEKEVQNW